MVKSVRLKGEMKTKYKEISYFYPTSPNAIKYKMPNGGYSLQLVDENLKVIKTVDAFESLQETCEYGEENLKEKWSWMFDKFFYKSFDGKWLRY